MYNLLSYKTKQFFWLFIKLTIVFGCIYFIYQKLAHNNQLSLDVFYLKLVNNNVFSLKNIFLLIFLTCLNWFLEILKWQTLVNFLNPISLKFALKQSLSSLTASLITPNRIGEYGAKAIYFEKKNRKKILSLNLVGNLHQLFATVFFGFLGLIYLCITKDIYLKVNNYFFVIIIVFLLILAFFFIRKKIISKNNIFKNYHVKITLKQHFKILFFSFLRYLVFSHQLYLLLFIFKLNISYINAMSAISSMYLVSSLIPMLSLFDVVVKGTVAIFIFKFLNVKPFIILSITTFMWILNFVIPALIGGYFVLTFKPKIVK